MKIIFKFVFSAVTLCWALNAQAALVEYFGQDKHVGPGELLYTSNSVSEHNRFLADLAALPGTTKTEGFDAIAVDTGAGPGLPVFGGFGTLNGGGHVSDTISSGLDKGPIYCATCGVPPDSGVALDSRDNYWTVGGSGELFSIAFNGPVRAASLFVADFGEDGPAVNEKLQINYFDGSSQTVDVPHSTGLNISKMVFYYGFVTDTPFTSLTFINTGASAFGHFDEITVQAVPLPPSVLLLFSGLTGLALLGRRKARQV